MYVFPYLLLRGLTLTATLTEAMLNRGVSFLQVIFKEFDRQIKACKMCISFGIILALVFFDSPTREPAHTRLTALMSLVPRFSPEGFEIKAGD